MNKTIESVIVKPLMRGHMHQAAFFAAIGAGSVLMATASPATRPAVFVYAFCLMALFGVSSLYHRPNWKPKARMWMRRLDHSAIFLLIAGTATPVVLVALPHPMGVKSCALFWVVAGLGILQSMFWPQAPKWLSAILYIGMGWLIAPYMPELSAGVGPSNFVLLLVGGVIYTVGALIYAAKRPNPSPRYFGYHEIFHMLVIVGAVLHFVVISRIT